MKKIVSVTTVNQTFWVMEGVSDPSCFDEITEFKKNGVAWYRCLKNGSIIREINSAHVIDVCYEDRN
jgi:hypothetical protein